MIFIFKNDEIKVFRIIFQPTQIVRDNYGGSLEIMLTVPLSLVFSDIVTEKSSFEIESFIPVLRERMYAKDRSELIFNFSLK